MVTPRRDDFAREGAQNAEIPELSDIPKFIRQILETSFLFNVGNADDLAQLRSSCRWLYIRPRAEFDQATLA